MAVVIILRLHDTTGCLTGCTTGLTTHATEKSHGQMKYK